MCASSSIAWARCPRPGPSASSPRWHPRSTPPTCAAWCTATSSRPTCCSTPPAVPASRIMCTWPTSGSASGRRSVTGLTSIGQFLGTPAYVAPEQVEGHTVDGRADQYALACTAFEMLCGSPPFERDDDLAIMWAQVSAPPPSLSERRPDLAPAVDAVLRRALAKSPGGRFPACLAFAAALRAALGLHGQPAAARSRPQGRRRSSPGPRAGRGTRPSIRRPRSLTSR
jgi:serine/threonine protein kinase